MSGRVIDTINSRLCIFGGCDALALSTPYGMGKGMAFEMRRNRVIEKNPFYSSSSIALFPIRSALLSYKEIGSDPTFQFISKIYPVHAASCYYN